MIIQEHMKMDEKKVFSACRTLSLVKVSAAAAVAGGADVEREASFQLKLMTSIAGTFEWQTKPDDIEDVRCY